MKANNDNKLPLSKKNYIYMLVSVAICAIGYMMMIGGGTDNPNEFNAEELYSFRRITLSVITVLIGHGLMIYAIMHREEEKQ